MKKDDDDSYDDTDDETKQASTIFQFKSISCEWQTFLMK